MRCHGSHSDWKKGKTLKTVEYMYFPVREKSGNFDQTEKVGEIYPKYWGNPEIFMQENWDKFWKSEGNLFARKSKPI